MQKLSLSLLSFGLLLLGDRSLGAEDASLEKALIDPAVGAYFTEHCVKCHGPKKQENEMRLDTLSSDLAEAEVRETWMAIAEAIERGDMPPAKEPRPPAAKSEQVVHAIAQSLARVSAARPIALRRMNREEYENTVCDLLGIDVRLAELLPEDSSVQGFDNVADGLSISSVLMERYLEAAHVAIDHVIRRIPPLAAETRRSVIVENKDNVDSIKKNKGGVIEAEASLVKFTPGWPPVRLDEAHPIEEGMYRCRIAVWPYQPSERTLVAAVFVGPLFGPGQRKFMGMYDVAGSADNPRVIEFTARMAENDAMHIVPWIFPEHVTYRDKNKEPRPGIAVAWAETHGPLDQSFPSQTQRKLFGESVTMIEGNPIWMRHRKGVREHLIGSANPREDAERILQDFVPKAFRRPVAADVVAPFIQLAHERLDAGRPFEEAVRAALSAVLCSPRFLLLNREAEVDDYALASRLSYFLWSTLPDEDLLRLAAEGKLREAPVRHAQVERMLKDPRSERFVDNFTGQWLDLREIEFTTPDAKLYPEFDPLLQESMLGETRGFFRHLLTEDLSVLNFIDSDFTMLNERLAAHYGIKGVQGHEKFRLVKLPPGHIRGGVLTQASVLKVTANGTTTSPVLRGVWVLDRMLGQPAPPPPPGVPAVEPDIRGATTIREQLDKHRSIESCARCHHRIDPPGFALECFDPIGGERNTYRSLGEGEKVRDRSYRLGKPVETDAEFADGRKFGSFVEFREELLKDREQIARAIAQKLLIYGTGRPVSMADRAAIEAVVEAARPQGLGLRTMVHAVVDNELFLQP